MEQDPGVPIDQAPPLVQAIRQENIKKVISLLVKGADPNQPCKIQQYGTVYPLFWACLAKNHSVKLVDTLIKRRINANCLNTHEQLTPLMISSLIGNHGVVELLLPHSDVSLLSITGFTSIHIAAQNDRPGILRLYETNNTRNMVALSKLNVDVFSSGVAAGCLNSTKYLLQRNFVKKITPMHIVLACLSGNLELVQLLFKESKLPKSRPIPPSPILSFKKFVKLYTVSSNQVTVVESFEHTGKNFDNSHWNMPYISAATLSTNIPLVNWLLEQGCPVNDPIFFLQNLPRGMAVKCISPLTAAALKNNHDLIQILLKEGANTEIKMFGNYTVHDFCKVFGVEETTRVLLLKPDDQERHRSKQLDNLLKEVGIEETIKKKKKKKNKTKISDPPTQNISSTTASTSSEESDDFVNAFIYSTSYGSLWEPSIDLYEAYHWETFFHTSSIVTPWIKHSVQRQR